MDNLIFNLVLTYFCVWKLENSYASGTTNKCVCNTAFGFTSGNGEAKSDGSAAYCRQSNQTKILRISGKPLENPRKL